MTVYKAPVADTLFVLDHIVQWEAHGQVPSFAKASRDMVAAILEEGARFVEEVIHPLNRVGDKEGCQRQADGSVQTPEGFKAAYRQFVEGGWGTLGAPEAFGGQGLPHALSVAFEEYMCSANMAFAMYPGLTSGAIAALTATGSDELKNLYLPKMTSGQWTGTMNLTEPHCGTDLGLIRTRAVPQEDGSYKITGTKIFISAGEHDLSENIIHLVLAKIEGAPDNVKGISLFVVPKFIPDATGAPGVRNALQCGAIEEKMGIHGNATCVMNYDGATGWLVGEPNKGLAAMFIMMNAARLGVGLQGLGQGEIAYQNAVAYAKERRQGRALTGPADMQASADPIIVHPDVRRMLMDSRALNEGLRALILWGALQVDLTHGAPDEKGRQLADDLISLLTPVIKGFGTDMGYRIATECQQVFGGHGYIAEWGMEQFVRDARIAQIYEGTNGVQAMDLVGRKLGQNGGRALMALSQMLNADLARTSQQEKLAPLAADLGKAAGELQRATMWLMQNAMSNPNHAGAAATSYLHLMGLVAVGLMWLRMAEAAEALRAKGEGDAAYLEAKLITARYYMQRFLPEAGALRRKIEVGAEALMALPEAAF